MYLVTHKRSLKLFFHFLQGRNKSRKYTCLRFFYPNFGVFGIEYTSCVGSPNLSVARSVLKSLSVVSTILLRLSFPLFISFLFRYNTSYLYEEVLSTSLYLPILKLLMFDIESSAKLAVTSVTWSKLREPRVTRLFIQWIAIMNQSSIRRYKSLK